MNMRNQFEAFIDDLRAAHGRNLASVILYGSAATGDFVKNQSDYNLLIALDKITPKDLRAAQAPMREWSKLGHPVPVYFTVSELETAADVFPIEFRQMEKARKILYGTDVLANVTISDEHLRHQTEFELRSKLIQLRRRYIPASVSVEGLAALMSQSLSSFAALFRAALLLHDAVLLPRARARCARPELSPPPPGALLQQAGQPPPWRAGLAHQQDAWPPPRRPLDVTAPPPHASAGRA